MSRSSTIGGKANASELNFFFSIVILLGAFVLYWHTLNYDFFIFDDALHVAANERVRAATWGSLVAIWKNTFMPIPYTLWWGISAAFGAFSAFPFHLANLILHAANTILLFFLLQKILPLILGKAKQKPIGEPVLQQASFIGALIFLFHPCQVESVVWISSAKGLLSFFFGFLSLYYFLHWRNARGDLQHPLLVFLLLALAGLSKTSAGGLVLTFLWLDLALARENRLSHQAIRFYFVLGLMAVVAFITQRDLLPPEVTAFVPPLHAKVLVALDSVSQNLSKLFLPISCYFDYGHHPMVVLKAFLLQPFLNGGIALGACLVLLGWVAAYFSNRFRIWHFAFGLILIPLLPYSGFATFAFQNVSTVADRYLYFSIVGLGTLGALFWIKLRSRRGMRAVFTLLILALFTKGYSQSFYWRDSQSLLEYTIEQNPVSFASRLSLGTVLLRNGANEKGIRQLELGNQQIMKTRTLLGD